MSSLRSSSHRSKIFEEEYWSVLISHLNKAEGYDTQF